MNFDFIQSATSKELEQFKSICNQLLSRTYIVRTLYRPGKGRLNNPDYTFLSLHYEAVQEYPAGSSSAVQLRSAPLQVDLPVRKGGRSGRRKSAGVESNGTPCG